MGFFRSLLKIGAPIVGGLIGGPAGAAIGAGLAGKLSADDQAKQQTQAAQQAGQTAMGGFNYLQGSAVGQQYLPAGGAAIQQEQGLLGIGGDPAAAAAGYQNYLNSVGYQGQLRAGQQGITGSAAAHGLLGSGSTAKALVGYGQQLGAQSFQNYLGNLHGVAGMGLQAGGMIGSAASQGYGQAAGMQFGAGQQAADTRAGGWDQLLGGLGQGYDAWQAGRAKTANAAAAGHTVAAGLRTGAWAL